MAHIALAEFADAFVIAPATANIIGKIASGIGDDLLSTTMMAQDKPTLICPAMNDKMLANPIVQENINKLKKLWLRCDGKRVKANWPAKPRGRDVCLMFRKL